LRREGKPSGTGYIQNEMAQYQITNEKKV
jgi:hypothetical protein